MPQITFGNKEEGSEEELTGISLGTNGGVETFLVVLPSGHVVARNKAPEAKAAATDAAPEAAKPIA
jgi:hypothetical protein